MKTYLNAFAFLAISLFASNVLSTEVELDTDHEMTPVSVTKKIKPAIKKSALIREKFAQNEKDCLERDLQMINGFLTYTKNPSRLILNTIKETLINDSCKVAFYLLICLNLDQCKNIKKSEYQKIYNNIIQHESLKFIFDNIFEIRRKQDQPSDDLMSQYIFFKLA